MANEFDDRLSGKASYIKIENTYIPIVQYEIDTSVFQKTVILSGHYNADRNLFTSMRVPLSVSTSAQVQGRFRLQTTPSQIVRRLYFNDGSFSVVFGLDAGNVFGYGDFRVSGFRMGTPIDGVVDYACSLNGTGLFFPNT